MLFLLAIILISLSLSGYSFLVSNHSSNYNKKEGLNYAVNEYPERKAKMLKNADEFISSAITTISH